MEVLFRFNLVRDAAPTTDDVAPIDLATRSRFQTDAAAIPAGDARRKALHDLAHAFIASNAYRDPSESPTLAPLLAVDAAIERLLASGSTTRTKVANALEAALGQSPDAWLATADVEAAISSLKDSIVAIKLSPADHARPILKLVAALRAQALIERFVADDTFPSDASALRAALRRGLRLPDAVLPSRGPPQTPSSRARRWRSPEGPRRAPRALDGRDRRTASGAPGWIRDRAATRDAGPSPAGEIPSDAVVPARIRNPQRRAEIDRIRIGCGRHRRANGGARNAVIGFVAAAFDDGGSAVPQIRSVALGQARCRRRPGRAHRADGSSRIPAGHARAPRPAAQRSDAAESE
ncbi:hypothetical protein L3D22_12190 [Lysobacter soli]|uniref:hypothetical protein n=1 Tax=Lysobacter soli TaxID=453783 RepID=UPI0020A0FF92|nr:hypothetical protein [Lysobacter soli]UTA53131.1 hypothetical protein L3D22_12190 [Lysobacter soli]